MPVLPITPTDQGCRGRAGISQMYLTECKNVSDLTFDENYQITAITMDAGQADPTFKLIQFERNTANFEQAKTVQGNVSVNVAQTISFNFKSLNTTTQKALYDLNQECCLHAIVRDNRGGLWYFGISYFAENDEWISEDLSTGEGSANSGTDPAADVSQYVESLVCNTNFYAPKFSLGIAGIPTA